MLPDFLVHYYHDRPFQTLTELPQDETERVLAKLAETRKLRRRLRSSFYFEQRRRAERIMHEQFTVKGGEPQRLNPHYAILGESEIWAGIEPQSLRIPLHAIPSKWISFTATDSWSVYIDQDLDGNHIPRKPHYGMLYRSDELEGLFEIHGWPGDRWKTEPEWEHDIYVEAQIWSDEPLREYLTSL